MTQTKRELRAERKAAREAAERAEAQATARRRRLVQLLGGPSASQPSSSSSPSSVSASGGAPETVDANSSAAKLVAGIPEKDGVLGDPKRADHDHRVRRPAVPDLRRGLQAGAPAPDRELRPHRQGQAQGGAR